MRWRWCTRHNSDKAAAKPRATSSLPGAGAACFSAPPLFANKEHRHVTWDYSADYPDPRAARRDPGLAAFERLGLRTVRHSRRDRRDRAGPAAAWTNLASKERRQKKPDLRVRLFCFV